MTAVQGELAERIAYALARRHRCLDHNGPGSGPCQTDRERAALVLGVLAEADWGPGVEAYTALLNERDDRLAAVEELHHPVPDPEGRPGVIWCSCAGGSEERPYYEYADCPTVCALDAPAGTLAKRDAGVRASALREAARELAREPAIPGVAQWLRERADRIEAEATTS